MFSEADFVGWLAKVDPERLRQMVRYNESLIEIAKQSPEVISVIKLAKPFIKYGIIRIDTNNVMDFLIKNRPDLYAIVTREWIQRQVDDFKSEIQYL